MPISAVVVHNKNGPGLSTLARHRQKYFLVLKKDERKIYLMQVAALYDINGSDQGNLTG